MTGEHELARFPKTNQKSTIFREEKRRFFAHFPEKIGAFSVPENPEKVQKKAKIWTFFAKSWKFRAAPKSGFLRG